MLWVAGGSCVTDRTSMTVDTAPDMKYSVLTLKYSTLIYIIEFGRAQIYGRLEAKSTFWTGNVWDHSRGGKVSLWMVAEKYPYGRWRKKRK